jgi:hypothetical protein
MFQRACDSHVALQLPQYMRSTSSDQTLVACYFSFRAQIQTADTAPVPLTQRRANFKRSHDGHVAILNKYSKQWTDVKCDLQVPGLLLLREASNQVSAQILNARGYIT